jgi:Ca2+-binding RTX toxin-like protein
MTLASNVENLALLGTSILNATGNTLANVLTGNSAVNTLDGGSGADTMVGGAGNDIYIVDNASDVVTENASEGTDTVQSSVAYALGANVESLTLTGTGSNNGTGNSLNNTLTGNSGANRLDGGTGNDTMVGGAGNDTYVVDSTSDAVTEASAGGIDTAESGVGWTLGAEVENLTLTGSSAINATGNTLANTLRGNAAANTLNGGAGADTMIGGAGDDIYVVDSASDAITELANEGVDLVQSGVTLTLSANVENLTLTGTTAINGTGNTLDNVLIGNGVNNTLTGAAGNDTLDGGLGNDTMVGGAGNDLYSVNVTTDVVTELANEGTDTVQSAVTLTLGNNVENLTLTGSAAINGTGNTLNNVLLGNAGVNVLTGAVGDDTYDGAAGNDMFTDTSTTSNDTYRWGIGSGLDTLTDSGGSLDHVDLFAGISKSQLKFVRSGNNLQMSVTGQTDKLTINSWYVSSANQIEEFRLSDGNKVLASDIQSLVSAMAVFASDASAAFDDSRVTILPARRFADLLTPSAMA